MDVRIYGVHAVSSSTDSQDFTEKARAALEYESYYMRNYSQTVLFCRRALEQAEHKEPSQNSSELSSDQNTWAQWPQQS